MPQFQYDALCVGIVVADHACDPIGRLPAAGELQMAPGLRLAIGGCASNVAVDLSRLGLKVAVVGRVGGDIFGRFVHQTLEEQGVDTSHLVETPGYETSGTLVINVEGEDRRFIHAFGANAAFNGEELDEELISAAPVLYLGGYLLMPNLAPESVARLFCTAQERGVTTVLDVAIPDPHDAWAKVEPVLEYTDIFLPNVDEAKLLTGLDDPVAQADRFRDAGAGTVVITCGGDGAVLIGPRDRLQAGSYTVPFVDGTGSGDAFDAGYIFGLLNGAPAETCLTYGSILGASCIQQTGATEGVFTGEQMEEFARTRRLEVKAI